MPRSRPPAPNLAETYDFDEAGNPPGSKALERVRHVLSLAALPATVIAIEKPCGLSRDRIKATLAVLEAAGEARLNKRGDAVFAFHPPAAPSSAAA